MNSIQRGCQSLKNKALTAILRGWKTYVLVTFIEAIVGVFLIYPFIGLADGFSRWNLAIEICENGRIVSDTLLSPLIAYVQALTWKVFNSYAVYTLFQAWLFYIAIGVNVRELLIGKWWWLVVAQIIVLFPTVYIFPLLLTDSAPIYIFIVLLISILKQNRSVWNVVAMVVLVLLCVGVRVNSLILMMLIASAYAVLAIIRKTSKIRYVLTTVAVVMGMILGVILPSKLLPINHNASVLGMVWEMTGICAQYPSDSLKNDLAQYGDINDAVSRYGEPYLNSIVWDNNPPYPAFDISSYEESRGLTTIYVNQVFYNTKHFLEIKKQFVFSALGISNQLITSRRGVHGVDDRTIAYGALPTARNNDIRELVFNTTDRIGFISLRPIVIMMLALLIGLLMKICKIECRVYFVYLLTAIGYYSSFLINTQAHEYRYFAPSFYILLVVSVCGLIGFVMKIFKKEK